MLLIKKAIVPSLLCDNEWIFTFIWDSISRIQFMYTGGKVKISVLILSLMAISNWGYSQNEEITIRFISNCGLHITDGNANIYVDFPYRSGAFIYDEFDRAEIDSIQDSSIFLFTHTHGDHYSRKNMKYVLKHKKGKKYGKWNIDSLVNLESELTDFKIVAIKNKHNFSFAHYSYCITWHGKRIFIAGDAESTETVLRQKELDWAFIPGWIFIAVLDEKKEIDTKMMGIYHIGPKDSIKIIHPKVLVLNKQGELITISNSNSMPDRNKKEINLE
ncbi:MAG: hypothetical protein COA38_17970 [Fluviicola sp.]|nr:MAG: hypothetical protein COA38_17970 [Fluviicola sp.]